MGESPRTPWADGERTVGSGGPVPLPFRSKCPWSLQRPWLVSGQHCFSLISPSCLSAADDVTSCFDDVTDCFRYILKYIGTDAELDNRLYVVIDVGACILMTSLRIVGSELYKWPSLSLPLISLRISVVEFLTGQSAVKQQASAPDAYLTVPDRSDIEYRTTLTLYLQYSSTDRPGLPRGG